MRKLLLLAAALAAPTVASAQIVINEVDSDTPGSDAAEFVELYNAGATTVDLSPYVLVFFNGSNDQSYFSIDLDGQTIQPGGYVTIGNPGVTGVDITFAPGGTGLLQNGADAVALYTGSAAAFPTGTAPTTNNLIDAIVYDTNDADDTGLLTGLGETVQYNESANTNSATESIQRLPDGSETFVTFTATPEAANLPVELSSFTAAADGQAAVLRWVTESETDNAGFSVETLRGSNWTELSFVAGRGTTSERASYEQRIDGLAAGTHRFRLVQRDLDGTATVAGTVEVAIGLARAFEVSVSGNATASPLVSLVSRESGTAGVSVFDVRGREVARYAIDATAGGRSAVTVSGLASGVYVVRVGGGADAATARIVVVR